MRKKIPRLVISFISTTDALNAEQILNKEFGRLIPLPTQINAACGLAWCANPADENLITEKMLDAKINIKELCIVELYWMD